MVVNCCSPSVGHHVTRPDFINFFAVVVKQTPWPFKQMPQLLNKAIISNGCFLLKTGSKCQNPAKNSKNCRCDHQMLQMLIKVS